jgi:hypothetical protein
LPIRKPGIGGLLKPEDCLPIGLGDADAAIIAAADANLGVGIVLGRRFVIPCKGQLEVLGDATAEFVQQTEHALGVGMSSPSAGSKNTFRYLIMAFAEGLLGGKIHSHEFVYCHDVLLFLRFIPRVVKALEG